MLSCDLSCMFSPAMYERFVMPYLQERIGVLDEAFYHLDSPGALPHLDLLLGIPNLKGIQWVPGLSNPPHEEWLDVLNRIVGAGKRCQLNGVSPSGALKIKDELGGRGFCFVIYGHHLKNPDEAVDLYRSLIA